MASRAIRCGRKSSNIDWFAGFGDPPTEPLETFGSSHDQNGLWPLRMAPSFGASMFAARDYTDNIPVPACPAMAAATDAAPAASAMM